jgi:NADH:ubiquinone oxidoreductase subunit H
MITMEFDELKKIWDSQNNQLLYAFDENALHKLVESKKKKAHHIANISELLLFIVNFGAGAFIFGITFFGHIKSAFLYVIAVWMFSCALYLLINRVRRIKENKKYDRTVLGDLNHVLSLVSYQVHLSQTMRWNILPVGMLSLLAIWEAGKSIWIIVSILIFFVLAYFLSGLEHNIYKSRKRELKKLQEKLEKES